MSKQELKEVRAYWLIKNTSDGSLWWSNLTGWGSKEGATKFATTRWLRLPIKGKWHREYSHETRT